MCSTASSGTGLVTYTYDGTSSVTSMKDWLGNTTSFNYDPSGNLVSTTLPSGASTSVTHVYDNAGALTDTLVLDGSTKTDLANLTRNADENISSTSPASGSATTFGYDALNRVTSGVTSGYTYSADSEITSSTPSGGSVTDYSYNADGRARRRFRADLRQVDRRPIHRTRQAKE
jgi:YD repeat-containing protein